ncbi:MAG: DUF4956 domain-containing protein [Clostridia bacterium]|nr:DUF4956 domain-containing protein [Clostridia bacterium]
MNTFNNIFKKSFLEGFASTDINVVSLIMSLSIAALLAMYIFFTYRIMVRKNFYSKNFNIALVGVALITTAIITTIQSSIVVSLGMVGALSIVRFRTAIKDPIDLMFLFWSISIGIICGAGLAEFAVVLSLAITIVIFILDRIPLIKAPMLLVVNCNDAETETKISEAIKKYAKYYTVKSRNMTSSTYDMIVEMRTSGGAELIKDIMAIDGVVSASLLEHDGEATF